MIRILVFLTFLIINITEAGAQLFSPSGPDCYLVEDLKSDINNQTIIADAVTQPTYDYTNLIEKEVTLPDGNVAKIRVAEPIPPTKPDPDWVKVDKLDITSGQELKIYTTGTIDLCKNSLKDDVIVAANENKWIDSNVYVDPAFETIELNIGLNRGRIQDKKGSDDKIFTNGEGLYIYIGDNPPTNLNPKNAGAVGSEFFMLYNESSTTVLTDSSTDSTTPQTIFTNYFSGKPPKAGKVWLRYKDANSAEDSWGTNYSDNIGQYEVKVSTPCTFANGMYLVGYIGGGDPNKLNLKPLDYPNEASMQHIGLDFFDPPGQAWADGKLWFKIMDNDYSNNVGGYKIFISVEDKLDKGIFSTIGTAIIRPMKELLREVMQAMFTNIIEDNSFQNAVHGTLVLYVTISFLLFMFGLIQVTQLELVIRVTKVSLLAFLISPIAPGDITPWQFFYDNFFSIVLKALTFLSNLMISLYDPLIDIYRPEIDFKFLDHLINILFHKTTLIKMFSLLFSGLFGIILFIIAVNSFIKIIWSAIFVIVIYFMANVAISLLIVVFPIFLIFMLFGQTKKIFDGWFRLLLNYIYQAVLTCTVFMLFSVMIFSAIRYALGFAVCKKCILAITLPIDVLGVFGLPEFKFCIAEFYQPWGFDNSSHFLSSLISGNSAIEQLLFPMLILMFLSSAMPAMGHFAIKIANSLAGTMSSDLGAVAGGAVSGIANPVRQAADIAMQQGGKAAKSGFNALKNNATSGSKDGKTKSRSKGAKGD